MGLLVKRLCSCSVKLIRACSCTAAAQNEYNIKISLSCKLLIVGAGAGGCSVAARFARTLKPNQIMVVEPSEVHYNQPQFTLVGGGIRKLRHTYRYNSSVLPNSVLWLHDCVEHFDPACSVVYTAGGDRVYYDYMVVAVGLKNDYEQIPGLEEALDSDSTPVSTIYSACYCEKTWRLIRQHRGGLAVFTRPRHGGKCSGAAHCVMYLADDYWRKRKTRQQTSITYVTGDDVTYGVPKYANALNKIAADRDIAVNCNLELVEVTSRGAVFRDTEKGCACITLPFTFLHVTPPMCPAGCLRRCRELVTELGYLDVDPASLQHRRYHNVFGIGDCMDTPNSKTAAAVDGYCNGVILAHQSPVVFHNVSAVMSGAAPPARYSGYGACPILTSYRTAILAEFLYDKQVWETFPFDQSKESRFLYNLKKDILPYLYWNKLLKGTWDGPARLRRIINPFGK